MEYPVSSGQIQSLPNGLAFMVQEGYIVPVKIPWQEPVKRAERLIPRVIQSVPIQLPPPTPIAPAGTPKPYRVRRKLTP